MSQPVDYEGLDQKKNLFFSMYAILFHIETWLATNYN